MLRTDRLILRPTTMDDVEALLSWQSLPDVCTYLPYAPRTRAEVAAKVGTYDGGQWVIERLDGSAIGEVMVFRSGTDLDLGYVLHPTAWGSGYATEAARAAVAWAWEAYPDDRVVAIIDPANVSSRRVLERVGFVEVGTGDDEHGPFVRFEIGRPSGGVA
ncbi:hypothetical protein Back2_24280 [Nocardioides baekrokdamisoli]|uniref:N-acetyltransferase domain-containing protein n=1 Tax=Nocardioides baekrokdamisoli TaxID=1804624 RepID=A0A3G9IWS5_9ACTN|nr:GNAT family N-acetyltransferase [Nocardioides baekrokdamisoli]BBH18141.1 hypothetical protein Back2_24280 [Nocardioides baekrokdamisoli]